MNSPADPETNSLTSAQLAIWGGQVLQPDDPLYNMALAFRIRGRLDILAFRHAFRELVTGCDALRTVIEVSDGMPRQRVLPICDYDLPLIDLSGEPDAENMLKAWLETQGRQMFDMARGLFDSALLRIADDDHVWFFNQHHIVTDASSVALIFETQQALYRALTRGDGTPAGKLADFSAYVAFEADERDSPANRKARQFWDTELAIPTPPSRFYCRAPATRSGATHRVPLPLGPARSSALRAIAEQSPFRSFTIELALFQLFATALIACLHRVTGNQETTLGTPSHNRANARFRRTAGLLIEMLPLRVRLEPQDSFGSLYARVARATQKLLRNAPAGVGGTSHQRAYDVVLNFITVAFGNFDELPTVTEWLHPGCGDERHLLRLQVEDFGGDGQFRLLFDLNEDVFGDYERAALPRHFAGLLDAMLEEPSRIIAGVSLVEPGEREQLRDGFRDRRIPCPEERDPVALFEAQVRRDPEAAAVRCGDVTFDYGMLDARANSLANRLASRGAGTGAVIGLMLPRSPELVVAMLGTLKSGASFVPLDPAHPAGRLAFMCRDAGVALVLGMRGASVPPGTERLSVEPDDRKSDAGTLTCPAQPADLAYVMYTSGSTGAPKGVMIERRSIANYLLWARTRYLGDERLAFPLFTSVAFDLTLTSILLPLVSGGSLVVYPGTGEAGDLAIHDVIVDNRVDVMKLTPAHLAVTQGMDVSASRLRKLILGGEDLSTELARGALRRFGSGIEIYNEYGPTEATIGCMIHRFDPARDTSASVPIGRAIDNLHVCVLDAELQLVPPGIAGELYIGGIGVARGYLGQDTLTSERFIDNPFVPGTRLYASGDLAAWNGRGELTYLGRSDDQVKIRGVRVEPREIERALLEHDAISECAVGAFEHGLEASRCVKCGLSSLHPEAHIDSDGVCRLCRIYAAHRDEAQAYFGSVADLEAIARRARTSATGEQACMMLLSGGKDSTYALCRLADLGLNPLVFTLDNGFISDGAKANMRRVVDKLGLELVTGSTPAMNAIFADSLTRFSNVCNGCFKTIYTLAMNLARERGIRFIFTGLSRGQIFETRVAGLARQRVFDKALIDRTVIEARKAYHRMEDAVSRHLDVSLFEDDAVFDEIEFVDFYRYCDVTLGEIFEYLAVEVPWIRPADTGRSTNCRINEAGIHVHKLERGFHNYALPYSWDVRLGHKERDAALAELDDEIDLANVNRILTEIDYSIAEAPTRRNRFLAAYYVSAHRLPDDELRAVLCKRLPSAMVPSRFVHLESMPLNVNGKLDRAALPPPDGARPELGAEFVAPGTDAERHMAAIWQDILGVDRVGIHDSFFDLGGDSIHCIQIVARARKHGFTLTPQQLFETPSVAALAAISNRSMAVPVRQEAFSGETPLLAAQIALFERDGKAQRCAQAAIIELDAPLDVDALSVALGALTTQHDALRASFPDDPAGRRQDVAAPADFGVTPEIAGRIRPNLDAWVDAARTDFSPSVAPLVRAGFVQGSQSAMLALVVHELVVDGVSWRVLLEDLAAAYSDARAGREPALPPRSASVQQWANAIARYVATDVAAERTRRWTAHGASGNRRALSRTATGVRVDYVTKVDAETTTRLLHEAPGIHRMQVPEILLTAILRADPDAHDGSRVRVDVESDGRESVEEGLDAVRTVGRFASACPLTLGRLAGLDPDAALLEVRRVWRAMPNRGMDYALGRYLRADETIASRLAEMPPARLAFRYQDSLDGFAGPAGAMRLASPVLESIDARSGNELAVSACVHREELVLQWTHDATALSPDEVARRAKAAIAELRALIDHRPAAPANSSVEADVAAADLNTDELEALLSEFGESSD